MIRTELDGDILPDALVEAMFQLIDRRPETSQSDKRWKLNTHKPRYAYRYFAVGQRHTRIFAKPDPRLTDDQIHDLKTGTLRLLIAGRAHYADMRGEKLWHNVSALWSPDIKLSNLTAVTTAQEREKPLLLPKRFKL
jgi:hypothetical protein